MQEEIAEKSWKRTKLQKEKRKNLGRKKLQIEINCINKGTKNFRNKKGNNERNYIKI